VTRRLLLALLLAAAALVATAPAATAKPKRLQAALDAITSNAAGPPGASVLIERGKRKTYLSSGIANLGSGAAPRPALRMRIASMAKAFSGAVALRLVDDGKLHLDDTVDEVLPGLWPLAGDTTLRQLLQHTGDLPDYIRDQDFIDELMADPAQYMTPEELIGYVSDKPPVPAGGGKYEYSDSDNILVGLMAEAATGRSYESLLRRYIYRPAGMKHTSLPNTIAMPRPFMHGYTISNGTPADDSELINPALAWASGGIVSTPRDVVRFFRSYLGGDLFDRKLQRQQFDFVKGSSSPPGPGENDAGLGIFRYHTRCGVIYGHTGSFPGYRLFAASTKDGKRTISFSVNSQIVPPDQGDQDVAKEIRRAQTLAVCRTLRG
jgi:D-alanyl-D-alanine carboxypeptidase